MPWSSDVGLKEFIQRNTALINEYRIEELLKKARYEKEHSMFDTDMSNKDIFELLKLLKEMEDEGEYTPDYYVVAVYSTNRNHNPGLYFFLDKESLKATVFDPNRIGHFTKEEAESKLQALKYLYKKIKGLNFCIAGVKK